MKHTILVSFIALAFAAATHAAPVSIFDGKSLDGWEGDAKLWRVEGGEIHGGSLTVPVPHNDFIATKKSYANFDLRVKLRLNGTGFVNSGVQIRSLRVPGSPEMCGYQVDYGKGWYGKLYDESRRGRSVGQAKDLAAVNAAIKEGDWNEYRIRTEGARIQSWINGVQALDYTEAVADIPQDGFIGIQIHGGGKALVQVKDITIEELPPTPDAPTWEKLGGVEAVRAKLKPQKKGADAKPAATNATSKAANPAAVRTERGRDISYNAVNAKALTAEEQQKLFTLPEGFSIELVASEATGVPKPTSIAFDDAGRMWITTATEYPRDKDPEVWTKPGKDRVAVIDSPHLPGPQPVRTFADGLVMPLGVLPYGDGAFIAQGPEILFLEDTDKDGKADVRKVLIKGFGTQDTHTLPHQLARMPGGRIVFSQGVLNSGDVTDASGKTYPFGRAVVASMTAQGTDLQLLSSGLNNIWAWAHDRLGRVFIQEANDRGYSLVPFEADSSYPSFVQTMLHPDTPIHPPTAERLNLGGTGLSGIAIADDRSGSFPAPSAGVFFVANPVLGKVHGVDGTQQPDGVWKFSKHGDLVTCSDPMFRPVHITFGPDGCLYIVDWYNRIISHNEVARDHPGRDKEHGRIWRVRHVSQKPAAITDFTKLPTDQLPAALASDSTWAMRSAWHQIGARQDKSVVPALMKMLNDPQTPADTQIHALWSLEDLRHFDASLWKHLFSQNSADLRREAIRALTTLRVPQTEAGPLLKSLANETAWSVRYEILRYFRQAGPISAESLAWLHEWQSTPALRTLVQDRHGFLALDGTYQRAFQDFLMKLAETKTPFPMITEPKWAKVIGKNPNPMAPQVAAERIAAVKSALPNAKAGDGKALTESICLTCHALGNKGIGFAPPLDGSGSRDLDGLLTAIADPDAAMESVFRLFRIITKDGRTLEGFKRSESKDEITVLLMGGVSQVIAIKDVKQAGYIEGQSVMPNITGGMTPDQVASIVAYLRTVK